MNKKEKSKNNGNAKKEDSSSIPIGKTIFIIISSLIGITSYYIYNDLHSLPEIPIINPDEWWGPYPINPKQDLSIRNYKIEFSEVMVNDLKERLLHTRPLTPPLETAGFTYGFNTNFLTRILDYWKNKYNFKERELFLNKFNHFITNIQGLDIHYIHVKPNVSSDITLVPLLMLHGWPGSIREFYEIIPKLTTSRPGYKFVFEVIAPSLPGYGFSQASARPGLGAIHTAVIMHNLMKRIGFQQFYIQGGDWGSIIGSHIATLYPNSTLGFHTNMPVAMTNRITIALTLLGSLWPSLVVEPELESRMYPLTDYIKKLLEESGYYHLQATKPDTVGVALTDSPAGLAAYILEKFSTWTNPSFKTAGDGNLLDKFSLTHLLDNIMIYWSTNSITSSMRLYAESVSRHEATIQLERVPTNVPVWGIKFKHEILFQPDFVLRYKFRNYLHSTIVNDGGHFAALENPDILADDIFEAVTTFKLFHSHKNNQDYSEEPTYETATTIYDFTVEDISGKSVKLDRYKGHVLVIVNVASQCGLTDTNYKQLNELYDKYAITKGLRIMAFPCNQFNNQEPGTAKDILTFAKQRGVKFDLFQKVEVNGVNAHPLWKFLKKMQSGILGDSIKWNFTKFIIDKNGVPVERLGPNINPLELEPFLAKYW